LINVIQESYGKCIHIFCAVAGVVYIRYCQVENYFETSNQYEGRMRKINNAAGVFGVIAVLGPSVVGCFQESNVLSIHVVGAFMAFMGGSIYLMFQVKKSH